MPSVVDICNIALSHIGAKPDVSSISPPEGSVSADYCATFWPMARDMALEDGAWGFATRYRNLSQSVDVVPGWSYKYVLPVDCIKVIALLQSEGVEPQDYKIINDGGIRYVVSNTDSARIEYVTREDNTNVYSPSFVDAVSWLLASYLAMPITRDIKLKEAALNAYNQSVHGAMVSDANQSHKPEEEVVWLEDR